MKSTDYIIATLKKWNKRYHGIQLKYAYDRIVDYHIIEVSPESIHAENDDYKHDEAQLWRSFSELFQDEDLLITRPRACDNMENVLYSNICEKGSHVASSMHYSYQYDGYRYLVLNTPQSANDGIFYSLAA